MHARRHHFFHVFEQPGPGKSFALDQSIYDLGFIARGAVLGTVQEVFSLCAKLVALRNFLPQVGDGGPVAARVAPSRHGAHE